jgi:broad specificity phosphatase PhoE
VQLTLVRHGQSTANRDGILQGRYDSPLSDLGRLQAAQLGAWFCRQKTVLDAVYSSPLTRARDTAQLVTEQLGRPPVVIEPDLAEIHAGQMQEKTGPVLRRDFPTFYQRGIEGLGDYSEFGGESYDDVQRRVSRVLGSLAERHRDGEQRVLLVSHGGFLFQLAKALICSPVPRVLFLRFSNCSATRLNVRERRGTYIAEIEWHMPLELIGGDPSGGAAALIT